MRRFIQLCSISVTALMSCTDPNFNSTLDPTSENYIPPVPSIVETKVPRVLVTDFEGDSLNNLWGYSHRANDKMELSFLNGKTLEGQNNRVLQLDYDVSAEESIGIWSHTLGVSANNDPMKIGGFSPQAMGLAYITFFVKGEKGDEKFRFSFTDVDNMSTELDFNIEPMTFWEREKIRLPSSLQEKINFNALSSLNAVFITGRGSMKGSVFLDDIAFEWE